MGKESFMAYIEAPSPHLLGLTEKTAKNPHKV